MVVYEARAQGRSGRCSSRRQQLDERDVPDVLPTVFVEDDDLVAVEPDDFERAAVEHRCRLVRRRLFEQHRVTDLNSRWPRALVDIGVPFHRVLRSLIGFLRCF